MKTQKTISYESITLPVNPDKGQHIPLRAKKFIDHGNIMKTLAIAVRDNLATLLIGESGTGKTSAIRYLAKKTNNGLRRVNLNGGTTADELVGRLLINEKGTYWVDGILTEAMRSGEWIVLDEINAALPEVLFVLQSVMDDDGYLMLSEKDDKEVVHKHKDFRIFATCNPPEYAGTKEMNKALLSRFSICISAEFPPEKEELDIVEHHLGEKVRKTEMASKMISLANETRKAKEMGTADYAINTRDILNTLQLSEFMKPIEALELAFSNKLDQTDNKALRLMAKLHLPLTKELAKATRVALKSIQKAKRFAIGKTLTFEEDTERVFLGMTSKLNKKDQDKEIKKMAERDLGEIIQETGPHSNPVIKGEEIKVKATYYEDEENGASLKENKKAGDKIASIVEITKGGDQGRLAVVLHHKDLNDSHKIVNKLSELS